MKKRMLEIMDTTLRDGEQTSGVSFSASEKLTLAKLLLQELKVDRIEIASARVSDGEFKAVKEITSWAKDYNFIEKIEVLTFVDGGTSIKWMQDSGAIVQNLLTKGSLNHLKYQLNQKPLEHFNNVKQTIKLGKEQGFKTNVYLEDWSNGMRHSESYVFDYLDFLSDQPIERVLLPDTLGVLTPELTKNYLTSIIDRYPSLHFDFHGHNDYDLSVANTMEAVKAGVNGLHLTVNGMGERAGNAPLASVVAVINDFMPEINISINEDSLFKVSQLVATLTGFRIPANKPIVGENVFTQTAGIHADGDSKKNLYFNNLLPERFGRKRKYALGKTSGKANIQKNLQELGLTLNDVELKKVTQRIIELGDKKERMTAEDLPFIISDVLGNNVASRVKIKSYVLTHSKGLSPTTSVSVEIDGKSHEQNASGDGQYDAFWNALQKIYYPQNIDLPRLIDYAVRIPPGSNSDGLCETTITWKSETKEFTTRGLDSDQTVAAIKATEKMLNIIQN
ncbi:MAG: 2-isopropylmalate synthase [Flavobacteriaceae bacterium]|jgi:D-citramalate synthase|nr:2-isopropylmalate synthase [Flavobacteriaceae bacterium]MBT4313415.1 2-isopropylmalate synthase [Flavobacteriaceae bacterium]MBT5092454.1 2-isopropylmalate synthase [Flavobacteriaceae bacterium]MBT5283191.1 2-isopropylmalate synthase [Flavobacteriaceae bacterium]MBT5447139.1 2-isopropylmalate synthase [Flavobacteriaceae bacterium]